ncbi:hypothetical protein [Caldicellulosiruptor bescii]|nr:hypothetical protein [Caldicellulosiruptor bescii]
MNRKCGIIKIEVSLEKLATGCLPGSKKPADTCGFCYFLQLGN